MNGAVTGRRLVVTDWRKAQMERRHLLASIAFVALMILSMVGTELLFPFAISASGSGGDAVRQGFVVGVCALLVFSQVEFQGSRPPMAMPISFWVVLAYGLVSVSWSIAPLISVRRLILTGLVMWTVVRAVGDLGAVRTLNLLRWVLVAAVIADFAAVYLTPYGVHGASLGDADTVAGDWRGIFLHKNVAGPVLAITILLFLFDRKSVPWPACIAVIAITAAFLYKTNSKTSMLVLPPAIVVGCVMLFYDPRRRFIVWSIVLAALAAFAVALVKSETLANLLNDPQAFTGRGRIWHILLQYASENPWFGTGYGAFWQIGPASPVYRFDNGWVSRSVSHGHNGYLDLVVTVGVPGMVLAVGVLLLWPAFQLLSAWQINRQRRALLTAILVYCALHNLSESTLFGGIVPLEVLLVVTVVLIHYLSAQSEGWHKDLRLRLANNWKRGRVGRFAPSRLPAMGRRRPEANLLRE
jgi:O-antigen ligase